MNLDTAARASLVDKILCCLVESVPGSEALLRGSLADNRADQCSDIDVLWDVPDASFQSSVDNITQILSRIQPVESIRSDRDFQNSEKRRLFFVRFEALPLFWRLDLDVFAKSIHRDENFDVDNPAARGATWSVSESALANAVGAVKAHLRGNDEEAKQLVVRAYERVGLPIPQFELKELILHLSNQVQIVDPSTKAFAEKIEHLVLEVF